MKKKIYIKNWIANESKPFMREMLVTENPIMTIMSTMLRLASMLDALEEGETKWMVESKLIVLDNLWQTLNEKMAEKMDMGTC